MSTDINTYKPVTVDLFEKFSYSQYLLFCTDLESEGQAPAKFDESIFDRRSILLKYRDHALFWEFLCKKNRSSTIDQAHKAHLNNLAVRIMQEQNMYAKHLMKANIPLELTVPEDVIRYANEMLETHWNRVKSHPRYYTIKDMIPMQGTTGVRKPIFHHIQTVLKMGKIPFLIIPTYKNKGLHVPQDYKKISQRFPTKEESEHKDKMIFKTPIKDDPNARKLALKNEANIILTSSCLQTIFASTDNCKGNTWEMTFRVEECGSSNSRKMVFIDKPIKPRDISLWEKNEQVYKRAVMLIATHPKHIRAKQFNKNVKIPVNSNKTEDKHLSPEKQPESNRIESEPDYKQVSDNLISFDDDSCDGYSDSDNLVIDTETTDEQQRYNKRNSACPVRKPDDRKESQTVSQIPDSSRTFKVPIENTVYSDSDNLVIDTDKESTDEQQRGNKSPVRKPDGRKKSRTVSSIPDSSRAFKVPIENTVYSDSDNLVIDTDKESTDEQQRENESNSDCPVRKSDDRKEPQRVPPIPDSNKTFQVPIVPIENTVYSDSDNLVIDTDKESTDEQQREASTSVVSPVKSNKKDSSVRRSTRLINKQNPPEDLLGKIEKLQEKTFSSLRQNIATPEFKKVMENEIDSEEFLPPKEDFNVRYELWRIGHVTMLVRCSVDGFMYEELSPILNKVVPKIEYKAEYGGEQLTPTDYAKQWISTAIIPNCRLARFRIDAFKSVVVGVQHLKLNQVVPTAANFKPFNYLSNLATLMERLSILPPGCYLLSHTAGEGVFKILREVKLENADTHSRLDCYDLHNFDTKISDDDCVTTGTAPWFAIDPNVILFKHQKQQQIPSTFIPKGHPLSKKEKEELIAMEWKVTKYKKKKKKTRKEINKK